MRQPPLHRLNALGRQFTARARAFPPHVERAAGPHQVVVLLHGLGRTRMSLLVMERVLRRAGYAVVNQSYPSKSADMRTLAALAVGEGVGRARAIAPQARIHFVAHSMGGILLRAYFSETDPEGFGRAVLLSPPNKGSEIVDFMKQIGLAEMVLGPAGAALGAADEEAAPAVLPDLPLHYGVIAGDRSLNPAMSALIPGPNDGKVAVAQTLLPGAKDHIVLPVTHTLMMNEPMTLWQTARFLRRGAFDHAARLSRLRRGALV